MTELELALSALDRAESLLTDHRRHLPESVHQQLTEHYESLRGFLSTGEPRLAAVIATAKQAEAYLWDALLALEGRLRQVEAELRDDHDKLREDHGKLRGDYDKLREIYDKLREDYDKLRDDHDKLLLRQMGSQLENKLARYAVRELTPKQAAHTTFSRLSKGQVKHVDKAAFERVATEYPGLEGGLEALKVLGTPVAHPELARTSHGQQPVTSELLEQLINKEFAVGDPVKSDVEEVLTCLCYLAQELSETLFVSTM